MDVTVKEARNRLDQLLDLADSGVEVVVTREGRAPVRLVRDKILSPAKPRLTGPAFIEAIEEIVRQVKAKDIAPELRTSNHDDLYDEHGAPR